MGSDLILATGLVVTAVLAAVLGLLMLVAFRPPVVAGGDRTANPFGGQTDDIAFIFDGDVLVDATPDARALLHTSPVRGASAWTRLMAWLAPRFPDAASALSRVAMDGRIMLASRDDSAQPLVLVAENRGGLTRLVLLDADAAGTARLIDRATQDELDQLRATLAAAPLPVWRESTEGDVIWANATYLDEILQRLEGERDLEWPLPRLFDRTASAQGAVGQRQKLDGAPGRGPAWFDLVSAPDGEGRICYALPADAAVQAEGSLRAFMQTLTKTFAHLTTGLAIFDEGRRLQLFNPALTDLTGLPADFLTLRPTLPAFFDAMRDRAMIPEPRDYRSWRRQLTEMERSAATGLYQETWTLPGGQTYRVSGRPHPNGALALMFEDISTEMSQTRRYRADLELGQSVIDAMDEAIAVFSTAGVMVMSNSAYAALWGHDPAGTLDGDAAISGIADHWRSQTAPSTVWDLAEDYVLRLGQDVGPLGDEAWLADGRRLRCRFSRLSGGATLAAFRVLAEVAAPGSDKAMETAPPVRRSA